MTSTEQNISDQGESEFHIGAVFSLADTSEKTGINDDLSSNIKDAVPTEDTVAKYIVSDCQLDPNISNTPEAEQVFDKLIQKGDIILNYTFPVKGCSVRLKNIINCEIKQKLLEVYKKNNLHPELDDVEKNTTDSVELDGDLDPLDQSRRTVTRKRKMNSLLTDDRWLIPGAKIPRQEKISCEIDHDLVMSVVQQIEDELKVSHDSYLRSIIPTTLDVNINNTTVCVDWSTRIQHNTQHNLQSLIKKLNWQINRNANKQIDTTKNKCIRKLDEWRDRIRCRMKMLNVINNSIETMDTVKVVKSTPYNTDLTSSKRPLPQFVPRLKHVTSDTVRSEVQPNTSFNVANKQSVQTFLGKNVQFNSASEILFGLSRAIQEKRLNMEATSCTISNGVQIPENKPTKKFKFHLFDVKKALQKKLMNECRETSSECGIENLGVDINQRECMRKPVTALLPSPENNNMVILRDDKFKVAQNFDSSQNYDVTRSLIKESEGQIAQQRNKKIKTTSTPADFLVHIRDGETTEEISASDSKLSSTVTKLAKMEKANKFYQLIIDNKRVLIPTRNDTVLPKAFVMDCADEHLMSTQAESKVEITGSVKGSRAQVHTKQPFLHPVEKINSEFYQINIGNKCVLIPIRNDTDLPKAFVMDSIDEQLVSAQADGMAKTGSSVKVGQTKVHKKQPPVRGYPGVKMNQEFSVTKWNTIPQSTMTSGISTCSVMNQSMVSPQSPGFISRINTATVPGANVQSKFKVVPPSDITQTKQQVTSHGSTLTEPKIPPVSAAQSTLSNSIQTKYPLSSSVETENSISLPGGFRSTNNSVNVDSPIGYICSDTLVDGKWTLIPTVVNTTSMATLPQQSATYTSWPSLSNTPSVSRLPDHTDMIPSVPLTVPVLQTFTHSPTMVPVNICNSLGQIQFQLLPNLTPLPQLDGIAFLPVNSGFVPTTSTSVFPSPTESLLDPVVMSAPTESADSLTLTPSTNQILTWTPLANHTSSLIGTKSCSSSVSHTSSVVSTRSSSPSVNHTSFVVGVKSSSHSVNQTMSVNGTNSRTLSANQTASVIGTKSSTSLLNRTLMASSNLSTSVRQPSVASTKPGTPLVKQISAVGTKSPSVNQTKPSTPLLIVFGTKSSTPSVNQTSVDFTKSCTTAFNQISAAGTKPSTSSVNRISAAGTKSSTPSVNQLSAASTSKSITTSVNQASLASIASRVKTTETKAGLAISIISDNSKEEEIKSPDTTSQPLRSLLTNVSSGLQNNVTLGANATPQKNLVSPPQPNFITSGEQLLISGAKSTSSDIVKSEPHNNGEYENISYDRVVPNTGSEYEVVEREMRAKAKTYIPETESHVPAGESRTEEKIRMLKEKIRQQQIQVETIRTNLLSKKEQITG